MTYPFLLELSFGEPIPTGYVIYFSWHPQTPLLSITPWLVIFWIVSLSGRRNILVHVKEIVWVIFPLYLSEAIIV